MKRVMVGTVAVLMTVGILIAAEVTSVNMVGFQKVTAERGKFILVTSAFQSIDGSELKCIDVFGTQLPEGSWVHAYDPYTSAYVSDNLSGFGWSGNITFDGGMGFWIEVPDWVADPSYEVALKGQVPMETVISNYVANGFTLLGYPYTASVLWTNTTLAKNATPGDWIHVYDPDTGYKSENLSGFGWSDPNLVIEPYMGFWFQTSVAAYTNTEARPYNP